MARVFPAAFQFTPDNVAEWIEKFGPLTSVEHLSDEPQNLAFDPELTFGERT